MSRSYKKFPGYTDNDTPYRRLSKRQASKAVRRTKQLGNNGLYKKVYQSYNICDYKLIWWSKKNCKGWYEDDARMFKKALSK